MSNGYAKSVYAAFYVNKQEFHGTDKIGHLRPEAWGEFEAAYNSGVKRLFVIVGVPYSWGLKHSTLFRRL
ncbi:hypothetical protein TUM4438_17120 [Shewanella sairae]|uniref:Uncharacterized protein n=1 Tax=Shewanella sairae TaxID=190310 RepID=A0ABQ4PBK1_9GAMM|nr:hypothetical protein [Shewanella sairae]MCL1128143.1 hypothetical protein [Shewanella sairae]GIU44881.1 hypothetical protein TUM4438_17120 [Shewanella sairae]